MLRWIFPFSHLSLNLVSSVLTNRSSDVSLGKSPALRVRRLSFLLTRSSALVGDGQGKAREALGQVFLYPSGQLGSAPGVIGRDFFESPFGAGPIRGVEGAADGHRYDGALVQTRHVGLGVLLQMKLTALPGHRSKDGGAGRAQSCLVVAGDELDAVQSSHLQAGQKGAPQLLAGPMEEQQRGWLTVNRRESNPWAARTCARRLGKR